jgi:hypothetical protein
MGESKIDFGETLKNIIAIAFCCFVAIGTARAAEPGTGMTQAEQIYNLLRTNLHDADTANLDHAAVDGLLNRLHSRAMLVKEGSNSTDAVVTAPLGKTIVFDGSYAYFRVLRMGGDLAQEIKSAWHRLGQTNKAAIKGAVLDLRFAGGNDYACAGSAADCFLNADRPLMDWGTGSARATEKSDAISVPVALLVNGETSEAAEAFAAALRSSKPVVLIGSKTAGDANAFKDFPLSSGDKLRIAMGQIKLGDGTTFGGPLDPDIAVNTSAAEDESYLKDPFQLAGGAKNEGTTNSQYAVDRSTVFRRFNEVQLIREHKEGADLTQELGSEPKTEEIPPQVTDPALARGLDLLKGLDVVQRGHSG